MPKIETTTETTTGRKHYRFWCPGCDCSHSCNDSWQFNGDVEKPTFRPSILVNGNAHLQHPELPRCHSFITDGMIQFLSDCTHSLAGQTVPMEDVSEDDIR